MAYGKRHLIFDFSIVQHALDLKKDVLLLNVGPTRADSLGVEKIEWESGDVLKDASTRVV